MTNLIFRNRTRTPSFFDTFFDNVIGGTALDDIFRTPPLERGYDAPQVRVDVKDEAYDVSIATPGLSKDAVDVSVKENVLTVSHENKKETENSYFCSSFKKSWTLPRDVNADQITAKYDNGVFNVSVPRVQPVEPEVKKIKIK